MKDSEYTRIHKQLKAREELLKMAKNPNAVIVDPISGEQLPRLPLKTIGKTIAKMTFK